MPPLTLVELYHRLKLRCPIEWLSGFEYSQTSIQLAPDAPWVETNAGISQSALVTADNTQIPLIFALTATQKGQPGSSTPRFYCPMQQAELATLLNTVLTQASPHLETVHGVFLQIFDLGVLITGEPGIGKSELALNLLDRKHRMIADDIPLFARNDAEHIRGICPAPLQDYLALRGMGMLNIRSLFGDRAIAPSAQLDLVIELQTAPPGSDVHPTTFFRHISGVEVPGIALFSEMKGGLALAAEVLVKQHRQKRGGTDDVAGFLERLKRFNSSPSAL